MSPQKPNWAVWQLTIRVKVLEAVLLSMDLDPHTVSVDGIDTVSRDLNSMQRTEYQRRKNQITALLSPYGPLTNHTSTANARSLVDLKEAVGFMVQLGWRVPEEFQSILQKDGEMKEEADGSIRSDIESAYRELEAKAIYDVAPSPNFDYWNKLSRWPLVSACQIVCNVNPDGGVNKDDLTNPNTRTRAQWVNIYHWAEDAIASGALAVDESRCVSPGKFCEWVQAMDFKDLNLPDELQALVQKDETEAPLKEPERASLLKMVLAMAVAKCGHLPGERSPATGDGPRSIAAYAKSLGLDLSNDTVKKYLDEAYEKFPDITLPNKK